MCCCGGFGQHDVAELRSPHATKGEDDSHNSRTTAAGESTGDGALARTGIMAASPSRFAELGSTVLAEAWGRFKVEGHVLEAARADGSDGTAAASEAKESDSEGAATSATTTATSNATVPSTLRDVLPALDALFGPQGIELCTKLESSLRSRPVRAGFSFVDRVDWLIV